MYKLLLALGIIDLAFQFPHLTALTLVGVFLYDKLTNKDKEEIMSIYSNGKEFAKYLNVKAKELGLTIKELRKKIVIDNEIPEVEPDYAQAFDEEPETDPATQEFYEKFVDKLSPEEQELLRNSDAIHDKLASIVRQAYAIDNVIWVEASLNDCLMRHFDPKDKWSLNYRKEMEEDWGIFIDWDKPFTEKDYRQLKLKLKALSRNPDGTVKDEKLLQSTDITLDTIYNYFTDYQFCNNNY